MGATEYSIFLDRRYLQSLDRRLCVSAGPASLCPGRAPLAQGLHSQEYNSLLLWPLRDPSTFHYTSLSTSPKIAAVDLLLIQGCIFFTPPPERKGNLFKAVEEYITLRLLHGSNRFQT